jgi:two-component system, OmpR family, sensor histidine kinase KdpD
MRWPSPLASPPVWRRLAGYALAVEADRTRTALLVTVSHGLRTPLAAAQAAVSCLRCSDIRLTAQDHDELLATAGESLDQLSHLVTSQLDMTRLQAGALLVVPRPADLADIIARSLNAMGPPARTVLTGIPPGLPPVMADPVLLERVITNLTANALRYSPSASPPQLTACVRGDRVELRVGEGGPGVLPADRERIFEPFRRLGDTCSHRYYDWAWVAIDLARPGHRWIGCRSRTRLVPCQASTWSVEAGLSC